MYTFQLMQFLLLISSLPARNVHASTKTTTTVSTIPTDHCEKGWIYNDKTCYLLRDEYEVFNHADATCFLYGAELAYGRNEQEVKFLVDLVKNKTRYGWWYGVRIFSKSTVQIKDLDTRKWIKTKGLPLPKTKSLQPPQSGCLGLQTNVHHLKYIMIGVRCDVHLPYVCRKHLNLTPVPTSVKNDKFHFVQKNEQADAYWFSSPLDRLSYDDAVKACRDKDMNLLFAMNSTELDMISTEIQSRKMNHIDPWWIGLEANDGVYTWSSGVDMDTDILHWDSEPYYRHIQRVLLSDGTMEDTDSYDPKAPFICMRPHRRFGQFGCPHGWLRGNQSCYTTSRTELHLYKVDAERMCAKTDSHLISFDTLSEKQWFLDSNITDSGKDFWTSLSDKKHPGTFTWEDGSPYSTDIVTWQPVIGGNGRCIVYDNYANTIYRTDCTKKHYPGCQYKTTEKSGCVSKDWVYNNGYCYYLHIIYFSRYNNGKRYMTPFDTMLQFCQKDLSRYSSSSTDNNETMKVLPLKIDSQEVVDVYSSVLHYTKFWTGLVEDHNGVLKWADGTIADLSLFTNSHNGYVIPSYKTENRSCVVVNGQGEFREEPCLGCRCAEMVCEKEVPYPPVDGSGDGSDSDADGGAHLGSRACSTLLMVVPIIVSSYLSLSTK